MHASLSDVGIKFVLNENHNYLFIVIEMSWQPMVVVWSKRWPSVNVLQRYGCHRPVQSPGKLLNLSFAWTSLIASRGWSWLIHTSWRGYTTNLTDLKWNNLNVWVFLCVSGFIISHLLLNGYRENTMYKWNKKTIMTAFWIVSEIVLGAGL